jgi:hypothetical protein
LNGHRVELLDVPRLATQLGTLERRTSRGGKDSIDHPAGAHDDLGNAVAGALVLAVQQGAPSEIGASNLAARPYVPVDFAEIDF